MSNIERDLFINEIKQIGWYSRIVNGTIVEIKISKPSNRDVEALGRYLEIYTDKGVKDVVLDNIKQSLDPLQEVVLFLDFAKPVL